MQWYLNTEFKRRFEVKLQVGWLVQGQRTVAVVGEVRLGDIYAFLYTEIDEDGEEVYTSTYLVFKTTT